MRRWAGVLSVACGLSVAAACTRLPDPESPGAKLYADRCASGCHRAYAPSLMKYEMWKYQVQRMQGELVRHGMPPLTDEELATILDYLKRHSG